MRHIVYNDGGVYPIAILATQLREDEILKEYVLPWQMDKDSLMVLQLATAPGKKKTPASEMKAFITEELVPSLTNAKTQYVICSDADYFKTLTKAKQAEANLGYVMDSVWGDFKVVYVPNYRQVYYDPPKIRAKIAQGMDALVEHATGSYREPGADIIHYEAYPDSPEEIQAWLDKLLAMDCDLAIDIEAFALKHYSAGIGTISFAWSKTEGIAFCVDYKEIPGATVAPYGENVRNEVVRAILKKFFIAYLRKQMYHNISYDVYVLIYQLFMNHLLDTEGLLEGMSVMLRNWDCTKLITYLATNSCAGNELGLKAQAQEYAGNYAQDDIKDITRIPKAELLRYNLIDTLCTWFVYEKRWDTLVKDDQLNVYNSLFKPACVDIIQMQLTGMPIYMPRVHEVYDILKAEQDEAEKVLINSKGVQDFTAAILAERWAEKRNSKLKKKRVTVTDFEGAFNPNSSIQLQALLYEYMQLPVLGLTKSKQPSTEGDILKALVHHTTNQEYLDVLNALIAFKLVNKIITDFLPSFMAAAPGPDGWHYLFGNLNLGGTVSGRLSASDPNLQTIPSGSKYAKLIKSCFMAPPGWLFVGLDFASLEDRISALTTKDPNKLKVYMGLIVYSVTIDGVDHHIRDDDTIVYDGKTYTGEEFYNAYTDSLL